MPLTYSVDAGHESYGVAKYVDLYQLLLSLSSAKVVREAKVCVYSVASYTFREVRNGEMLL